MRSGRRYLIGISYVGHPEFTKRALSTLEAEHLERTIIIDGSEDLGAKKVAAKFGGVTVICPLIPYSHTQSMNYILMAAIKDGCDFAINLHNDAKPGDGVVEKLIEIAVKKVAAKNKWGVLFTNYDCLAAYNLRMIEDVGLWDSNLFPNYFSDNDFHRRVQLAGWTMEETGLSVEHTGSHVHKLDIERRWLSHNVTFDLYHEAFRKKWGGYTHEVDKLWDKPFNGELERLQEDVEQRPKP